MAHPSFLRTAAWMLGLLLLAGCGSSAQQEASGRRPSSRPSASAKNQGKPTKTARATSRTPGQTRVKPTVADKTPPRPKPPKSDNDFHLKGSLADLLSGDPRAWTEPAAPEKDPEDAVGRMVPDLPRMQIDDAKVRQAGIRKLEGKHLTLYTDLPSDPEIDVLPEVFDQAFPQWCAYFGLQPSEHADWRLTGFLMKDKDLFKRSGLMPDSLPPFPHGYSRNYEFWLYEQPSAYYRRHLLLHEGTHGFMNTLLGTCGPPWYMEGIAELLATHRWSDGHLKMNIFPASKEEVPMWGRIKIVRDALAKTGEKRLNDVIHYSSRAHRRNEPYGWCWAAAAFLDRHPRYRDRFRQLAHQVALPDFSKRFHNLFASDWGELCEEWDLYVSGLDYGYDIPRMAVEFAPGEPLPPGGKTVTLAADRGWQSSRVELEKGKFYRLTASGRYQVANQPQIWWCEPGGVSIRYVNGHPLGILLAAVRPDKYGVNEPSALLRPIVVGLETTFMPQQTGTLYLRINDSPNELADNAGTLAVRVEPAPPQAAN